jgi:hypothetical protein
MEEDASGYASASSHSSPSSTTTSSSARTVSNVPEFGEAVRYQPLDLKAMREAAAIGDEQQKTGRETEIRKRAQYYTFTDRRTRGPAYEGDRTYHVLSMESWLKIPYKSEYLNPNPELAHLPERY